MATNRLGPKVVEVSAPGPGAPTIGNTYEKRSASFAAQLNVATILTLNLAT